METLNTSQEDLEPSYEKTVVLTPRSRALLEAYRDVPVLDTEQAFRRHSVLLDFLRFPNPRAAARSMHRLALGEYLILLARQERGFFDSITGRIKGKKPLAYGLGPQGARLLGFDPQVRWKRRNLELKQESTEHLRLTSWVYVAFSYALRDRGPFPNLSFSHWSQGDKLRTRFFTVTRPNGSRELIQDPKELKDAMGEIESHPVYPDASFRIIRSDTRQWFPCCAEIDRNSMSNKTFIKKIENYVLWKRYNLAPHPWFLVLTVTQDRGHLERLLEATEETLKTLSAKDESRFFRFTLDTDFLHELEAIPRAIWRVPGEKKLLRPYE